MSYKVYLNGKFVDKHNAKISVFDHGLLYGDGVFEGIRSYNGLVFRLKDHIERLYISASYIRLKIPMSKSKMAECVINTLKKNRLIDAYIRLVVTRGIGDLGLDPRKCKEAGSVIIITDKIKLYPKNFYITGLHIVTAKTRRNLPSAVDPRIKSLNYLNNILGKIDAIDAGVPEAIMLTWDNYVAECTGDNIFVIKKGVVYTPPVSLGALEGITRDSVMKICKRNKIPSKEKKMKMRDLYTACECFLTGTAAEIIPVVNIDKKFIGNKKPGPITKFLSDQFREETNKDGVFIK